jgi:hypothetical protein
MLSASGGGFSRVGVGLASQIQGGVHVYDHRSAQFRN